MLQFSCGSQLLQKRDIHYLIAAKGLLNFHHNTFLVDTFLLNTNNIGQIVHSFLNTTIFFSYRGRKSGLEVFHNRTRHQTISLPTKTFVFVKPRTKIKLIFPPSWGFQNRKYEKNIHKTFASERGKSKKETKTKIPFSMKKLNPFVTARKKKSSALPRSCSVTPFGRPGYIVNSKLYSVIRRFCFGE